MGFVGNLTALISLLFFVFIVIVGAYIAKLLIRNLKKKSLTSVYNNKMSIK